MEECWDRDGNKIYLVGGNVFPTGLLQEDPKNVDIKRFASYPPLNDDALKMTKSKPRFHEILEKIRYSHIW